MEDPSVAVVSLTREELLVKLGLQNSNQNTSRLQNDLKNWIRKKHPIKKILCKLKTGKAPLPTTTGSQKVGPVVLQLGEFTVEWRCPREIHYSWGWIWLLSSDNEYIFKFHSHLTTTQLVAGVVWPVKFTIINQHLIKPE